MKKLFNTAKIFDCILKELKEMATPKRIRFSEDSSNKEIESISHQNRRKSCATQE